jgi:adenine-specific DNA-methyltransferase
MDSKTQLINKLKEIFQFPNADLDFGIYKVYKYKQDMIKNFIDGDIEKIIDNSLKELSDINLEEIKEDYENVLKQVKEQLGEKILENTELLKDIPLGQKYLEIKEKYEKAQSQNQLSEETKNHIYNHLYQFFSKYYKDGDFIPLRRWGNDKHIVFYNGQEVFFHWATKDMYYIKSGELFKEYRFKFKNKIEVIFKTIEVEDTKGNQKSDKRFFFLKDIEKELKNGIITIYFEYRQPTEKEKEEFGNKQEKINERIKEILTKKLSDFPELLRDENGIFKHLNKYTQRSNYDFFIHKNLKDFLSTELDFYIKNRVLHLENLKDLDNNLKNIQFYLKEADVIYKIASEIIEFLDILENFQKRLWNKPKFIIDTHYVITLDRLKDFLTEEDFEWVLEEVLNNKNQLNEWIELGLFEKVEEINKNSVFENGNKTLFEEKNVKPLPIDTKYFNEEFKWKLLNLLSKNENFSLDDALDGVLIKSDNYQALNLLKNKYKESIKTIYIDPPYNTGNDGFIYKDSYRHSSWLSMMENRLELARDLMKDDGAIFVSIDDNEVDNLKKVMNGVFGEENFAGDIIVKTNPGGRDYGSIAITHEYIIPYLKNNRFSLNFIDGDKKFPYEDELGKFDIRELRNRNIKFNIDNRPNLYYPIYVNPNNRDENGLYEISLEKKEGFIEVYPLESQGVKTVWRWSKEKVKNNLNINVKAKKKKDGNFQIIEKYRNPLIRIRSILDNKEFRTEEGSLSLKGLFKFKIYDYPKSPLLLSHIITLSSLKDSLILDFFAGSGTTAHAVMKLNAEDDGKRKFILVEMADYFDTVIIPRIKKVAYSFDWKEGKPQNNNGKGIFFKYHTLEQYEDSLENIEFKEAQQTQIKTNENPIIQQTLNLSRNDVIKYQLDKQAEKLLNIEKFEKPYNYKIKILDTKNTQKSEYKTVDLIETFIYLSGLKVEKIYKQNEYTILIGMQDNLKTLAIFREKTDKNIETVSKEIDEFIKEHNPEQLFINLFAETPILNKEIKLKSIEELFAEKMK